jgi:hypothetical protein
MGSGRENKENSVEKKGRDREEDRKGLIDNRLTG